MIDETNLVNELKNRNEDALNFIIDKYSNLLFKISYDCLKSSESAKECINEVLLKVWASIDLYNEEKGNFLTWLTTITKRTAIDMLKKEKKNYNNTILNETLHSDIDDIENNYITKNELLEIIENINSFEKVDRDIFILRFFVMKDISYIAKEVDLTENAVRLRISRARKKLKSNCN